MTAVYTVKNNLMPSVMQEIFCNNESYYNLRNNNGFLQPRVRSVNYGTGRIKFKGPQLLRMLPQSIRNSDSLHQFRANIQGLKREVSMQTVLRVNFYRLFHYSLVLIFPSFHSSLFSQVSHSSPLRLVAKYLPSAL